MKIPVLFPKIFNYPFTYQSKISDTLNPGDFVKAPFGSNEITGVVWPEEQKTEKSIFTIFSSPVSIKLSSETSSMPEVLPVSLAALKPTSTLFTFVTLGVRTVSTG